nr:hypothetical protein BaRGS_006847 [Batillaria attramentaria]
MKRIEEKDVLSKLVQQLCEEFDVRLLAIDSGLRFLMDVPVEEWEGVKELQKSYKEKLQKILEDALLSKQEKEEVTWTEVTSCNVKCPCQVCADLSGNVYIACSDSACVLGCWWCRLTDVGGEYCSGENQFTIKFADDTALVDLTNSDSEYQQEVDRFVLWCQDNCLKLNVSKTREMVIDFRKTVLSAAAVWAEVQSSTR